MGRTLQDRPLRGKSPKANDTSMMQQRIAFESRLRQCKNVITLGVRTNLSDYEEWQIKLIREADVIYYPTAFYADIFDTMGESRARIYSVVDLFHGYWQQKPKLKKVIN